MIDAWEHAQRSSFLGSAPRQAEVGRTYRIEDQSQARSLLVDAVEFAESEGWEMTQPLENKPDFNSGAKELAPGTGELSIALGAVDPGEPQGPRQLSIYIRFDPLPTD